MDVLLLGQVRGGNCGAAVEQVAADCAIQQAPQAEACAAQRLSIAA